MLRSRLAITVLALTLVDSSIGCHQSLKATQKQPVLAPAKPQGAPLISPIRTFKGHSDSVLSLAFSRDGRELATASSDHTVKLWDVWSGKVKHTMTGHSLIVWSVALSPDGTTLASGSLDSSVRLWDAKTGRLLRVLSRNGPVKSVAFSPDGKLIASAGRNDAGNKAAGGQVSIADVQTGKLLRAFTSPRSVESVVFSPDGKLLLAGGLDKTAKLWDVRTGRLLHIFTGNEGKGHHGDISRVAFSPDGARVAGGGWDEFGQVWLWNTRTGALTHNLQAASSGTIRGLAFSPNGKMAAAATGLKLQLWDAQTGKLLKSWGDKDGTESLAFTPDGKYLATGSREGYWRINKDRTVTSNIHGVVKFWSMQ